MTPAACPREFELLADLDAHSRHLAECDACAELVAARIIGKTYAEDLQAAHVPSAGQVWWRAQVRARADARHAAERPIHVIQAVAAAVVAGAFAAGVGWLGPWITHTTLWGTTTELGFAWWLAIGVWVILAPVALYLVFARE